MTCPEDNQLCNLERRDMHAEIKVLRSTVEHLVEALDACDHVFAAWEVGLPPVRPEVIIRVMLQVRTAITKAEKTL